jgi:uncharacterized ubiquitin-like protein YukD
MYIQHSGDVRLSKYYPVKRFIGRARDFVRSG